LDCFKEAKEVYMTINSSYGMALCNFSIGYIYRTKVSEFIPDIDEEGVLNKAK